MKFYRVTINDHGTYGPRGLTVAGTGLSTWANTDKSKATAHYNQALKDAIESNRKATLRLQVITTPDRMTTELWINAIVNCEVPYEITETLRQDKTDTSDPALKVA